MFKLSLKDEDILVKITVRKPVTNKEVVNNFIGNILTGAGGDIADKVYLILTNDTLYLEYKGHAAIGYAEEIRNVDNISLSDLKEFLVTSNKNEELIEIKTSKKDFLFIRDNTNEDNLALAMSKVINDIKFNI
ncbi:hypothetical protein [Clostridium sp.]|uniref:hypothetical protein n=1 Tax=Clostridium sp. TaxID=1506 RepID=UPI003522216E